MAASFIEMPVDGAGKKVQTWANTIGADNVHTEATTPTDSSGVEKATSGNPLRIDPTGTTVQPVDGALTNNNAAPAGTELGVLPALANAAAPTWVEGNQVLMSVDLAGNQRVKIVAGSAVIGHVITDSGSVTNATLSAETTKVIGTVRVLGNAGATLDNASASAAPTNTLQVGGTNGTNVYALNSDTSGNIGVNVKAALPAGTNVIGHVIADSGSTTVVTGTVTVAGAKTNNNAAPDATNVGVLPALANASAPTWTEGDQVLESVDLSGNQRVIIAAGSAVIGHVITDSGSVTAATLSAETTKVIGTVRIIGNTGATVDGAPAATAPTNAIQVGATFNTTPATLTSGQMGALQVDAAENLLVNLKTALPAGTNVIGHVIVDSGTITTVTTVSTVTAVTAITNALPAGTNTIGNVVSVPATSGGLTTKSASGLTNGAVAIKASAGQVYGYFLDNTENTATTFFQVYNTASGSVTVGTTAPLFSLAVPGGSSANLMGTIGIAFGTAISIAATTAYSNGSAPANTVTFTVWYA